MYKRIKQTLHRNPLDGEVVYFSYKRAALMEEVKKRTAYIGRNRTTKDGQSLMQQIALTTDESDIFQSYYLEASAEVYDVLSGLMPEDTTSYRVFPSGTTIHADLADNTTPTMLNLLQDQVTGNKVDVSMMVDVNGTDLTKVKLVGSATLSYDVEYTVGTNVLTYTKTCELSNVEVKAYNNGARAEMSFAPQLNGASAHTTAESYSGFIKIDFHEMHAELLAPVAYNAEDIIEVGGRWYQAQTGGVITKLSDMEGMNELPMDVTDSVMYRIGATAEGDVSAADFESFDTNAIPAVDIAIWKMLVCYIMWHWLLDAGLADDAMVQKQMYEDGEDNLSSRISKMKGETTNIVSRTW